jgi:hypothetical protein
MTKGKTVYQSVNPVNWESTPTVEGIIEEFRSVLVDERETPACVIRTEDSRVIVYRSSMLEDAFKSAKVGNGVTITCRGTKPLKGNRSLRLFDVSVWEVAE